MPPPNKKLKCASFSEKSISAQVRDGDKFISTAIFYHWFALLLYGVYLSAQRKVAEANTDIELDLDGYKCNIDVSNLNNTVEAIHSATTLSEHAPSEGFGILSSEELCSQEMTLSALFARALDSFLFKDSRVGACLHQGPVRKKPGNPGNPEAADMYVMPFHSFLPGTPLLVSDIKLEDVSKAVTETSLYAHCCMHIRYNCDSQLGFPVTKDVASLYVFLMAHGEVWGIQVVPKVAVADTALLCTV